MTYAQSLFREMKRTLSLAFPLVLGQLSQVLLMTTDNIVIGRLGPVPLAASSFASSLVALPMVFGLGFSSSVQTYSSRAHGSGNVREAVRVLASGLVLNALIGCLITGFLLAVLPLLPYFEQPAEIMELAPPFYQMLAWSMIPMMVFQCLRQFSEALNHTVVPMLAGVSGLIFNALGNYALVFGNWSFPALGLPGSGLATLLSRVGMCAIMMLYLGFSDQFRHVREHFRWNMGALTQLLAVGFPAGSQLLFEVGAFSAAAILMGWLGTAHLAAHQIALSICTVTFLMAVGLANATSIRLGQQLGQGHLHTLRITSVSGFMLVLLLMGSSAVGVGVFRHALAELYVGDQHVQLLAAELLVIAGVFQVFDGAQALAIAALRGLTDVRIPTVITFISYWLVALPVGWFFAFRGQLGAPGIWVGLCLGLIVASILLNGRLWRVTHLNHPARSQTPL